MNEDTTVVLATHRDTLFDRISFYILLTITFLTPLFFVPATFVSTQFGTSLLFSFGVIISLLIYIVSGLMTGSLVLPRSGKYTLSFLAIVPIVYTLAGVANGFSRMSFFGYTFDISTVGFIVLGFVYLFLVSIIFRNKNRIFYSYFAFVLSSLILSLFLLIRIIFGAKVLAFGIFTDLTSTTLGSWNNIGIFFGLCAILSLLTFEILKNLSKLMKILVCVSLVLSLFFLALVNFNIVWIIVGISAFLFILYSIFNIQSAGGGESFTRRLTHIPVYSAIVFVVSVAFVVWGSTLGTFLSSHLKVANVEVRPSLAVTLDIARNTLRARPLFGSGPNSFVTQWLSFKPDDITNTVFWNTDFQNGIGLIPTFTVTTGVIGIISWFLFLGFFVYCGVKSIFARVEDVFIKYLITTSFFISLYLWIMTFVYVPSSVIFILTFFFTGLFFASIYVADIIPMNVYMFGNNPRTGFIASLIMITVFISGCALGYGLFQNSESLWYFQKSSYALNTIQNVQSAEDYMAKAISAVPLDVYYRSLSEIELSKLSAIASQDPKKVDGATIQKQFSSVLSSAIKAGIAAKDADPSNYLNWISLGRVYDTVSNPQLKIDGAYESAGVAYNEAFKRNPKNPGILLLFARLAVTHGDLAGAKQYALQAIQMKQNYLDAYFLLTQIEVANKNIKGAIDSATAASVINPSDASIMFQLGLLKYNNNDFVGAISALETSLKLAPDYANAKYFLGLAYEQTGQHDKAIALFTDLKKTNPDNKEVDGILTSLEAGKSIFTKAKPSPQSPTTLPVKENQ